MYCNNNNNQTDTIMNRHNHEHYAVILHIWCACYLDFNKNNALCSASSHSDSNAQHHFVLSLINILKGGRNCLIFIRSHATCQWLLWTVFPKTKAHIHALFHCCGVGIDTVAIHTRKIGVAIHMRKIGAATTLTD